MRLGIKLVFVGEGSAVHGKQDALKRRQADMFGKSTSSTGRPWYRALQEEVSL